MHSKWSTTQQTHSRRNFAIAFPRRIHVMMIASGLSCLISAFAMAQVPSDPTWPGIPGPVPWPVDPGSNPWPGLPTVSPLPGLPGSGPLPGTPISSPLPSNPGQTDGGSTDNIALPTLKLDATRVTVSGLSGGAFMAVQLMMAASDVFGGAGSIAGGIPGCPQGSSNTAQTLCMQTPNQESVTDLLNQYKTLASQGDIPPLSNLSTKYLYIYNGSSDTTVNPASGQKLAEWAAQLMPESSITTKFDIASAHGFPTLKEGIACGQSYLPYINSCNYDAAGAVLSSLKMTTAAKGQAVAGNLSQFDQSPYASSAASMSVPGYIYVPTACQNGAVCGLHIALHGCMQSPDYVQTQFVTEAGYNDWAESNNLVILYPSVKSGTGDPYGCWDWWGYSGSNYLARSAPQIDALLKMVAHLSGQ